MTDVQKTDVQNTETQNSIAPLADEVTAAHAEWVKKKRHGSPAHLAAFERRMAIVRAMDKDTLPKDEPADIDTLRNRISRMIAIYVDDSEGCSERLCRRYRGCMAPNISCTNKHKHKSPPVSPEKFARFTGEFKRSMADAMAKAEAAQAGKTDRAHDNETSRSRLRKTTR